MSSEAATGAADAARQEFEKTKSKAGEKMEEAKQSGKVQLEAQKEQAARQAEGLSDSVNKLSQQLAEEDHPSLARYTSQLASGLSTIASKLQERPIDDIIADTEDFARREPALFLAGSVAVGFALSRFFRASARYGTTAEHAETFESSNRSEIRDEPYPSATAAENPPSVASDAGAPERQGLENLEKGV